MRARIVLALLIVLSSIPAALAVADASVRRYSDGADLIAHDAMQLEDGGYMLVGHSIVELASSVVRNLTLVRLDRDGDMRWQRTYEGYGSSSAESLLQLDDGGFVVVGTTWADQGADADALAMRIDSAGDVVWARAYGTGLNEHCGAVIGDNGLGYWLVGSSVDPSDVVAPPDAAGYAGFAGRSRPFVVRIDSDGSELWSLRIEGEANMIAFDAAAASDGIVILCGTLHYPEDGNDIELVGIIEGGGIAWTETWEEENTIAYDLVRTANDRYVMCGNRTSDGVDAFVACADRCGHQLWSMSFGVTDSVESAEVVAETTSGDLVCAGWRASDLYASGEDILLARIAPDGTLMQEQVLPSSAHNLFAAILGQPDGACVIAGSAREPGMPFCMQLITVPPPST